MAFLYKNGVEIHSVFSSFYSIIENIVRNLVAKLIVGIRRIIVVIGLTATSAHAHKKHSA